MAPAEPCSFGTPVTQLCIQGISCWGLQVLDHKEALAAISNEAVQVAALEEMLAAMADKYAVTHSA